MLLSGGVDSAVAMNILVKQNYNVTAFYLKIWLEDELAHLGQCPWEDDYNTCVAVCKHAGNIPLETISLQKEYKDRVISYTIQEARKGRTPNPDIMCNSRVKFGCFYDAIEGRDFDYVASGHYACTSVDNQNDQDTPIKLLRAPDPIKDQSYFLSALTQTQLKRILFPIGNLHKSQVRLLADELDLPNKNRPDSQGLCFLGKVKFDEFLQAYLGNDPGDIIDAENGQIIGRHNGIWFHTIGQRKGIGNFLLPKASSQGPWYVVAKDPQQRLIIASNQYDEDAFSAARSEFYVEDIKWISLSSHDLKALVTYDKNLDNNKMSFRLSMKIRHGPRIVQGTLSLEDESASSGKIVLDAKDGGLAPGQYVAFYLVDSLECLGSGVISEKHWVDFLTKSRQTRIDAVN
jgi:tRNA-specific 2-thiouridylase